MSDPLPPTWVCKRDGRLEPFQADRISRSLFAASESLGRPSAFLARELADSVVHFLSLDSEGQIPTTERVAEVVEQVLRQLGQAELANAFARHRQEQRQRTRTATAAVGLYSRDLMGVEAEGLVQLGGADTPNQLAGCVLSGPEWLAGDLIGALNRTRAGAGQFIALDGLEFLNWAESPTAIGRLLVEELERRNLLAMVNLNGPPPDWAASSGPLFAGLAQPAAQPLVSAQQWLTQLAGPGQGRVRLDWHLGEKDFHPQARQQLTWLVELALKTPGMRFVFDRPRRPTSLAEGLDRQGAAVLCVVAVHLPALAGQGGLLADSDRYRQRLGSLARLAVSAAVQKRDFVRTLERQRQQSRMGGPTTLSGFLLDRARLVVVPVGLDAVVRQFTGWGLANGGPSLELGLALLQRLREVLEQEGRIAQLDTRLDGPFGGVAPDCSLQSVAGPTCWDVSASLRSGLHAGAALHAVCGGGTLTLFVSHTEQNAIPELLEQAWRQTAVVRLRLEPVSG